MEINIETNGTEMVVSLDGRLDTNTAHYLFNKYELNDLINEHIHAFVVISKFGPLVKYPVLW